MEHKTVKQEISGELKLFDWLGDVGDLFVEATSVYAVAIFETATLPVVLPYIIIKTWLNKPKNKVILKK